VGNIFIEVFCHSWIVASVSFTTCSATTFGTEWKDEVVLKRPDIMDPKILSILQQQDIRVFEEQ
jgi:hypothetical protein